MKYNTIYNYKSGFLFIEEMEKIMNGKLKCASYMRLSKEDERCSDESSSISSQRMIIDSFAKFNNF